MPQLVDWLDARRDLWQLRRWRRGGDDDAGSRRGAGYLGRRPDGKVPGSARRTSNEAEVTERKLTPHDIAMHEAWLRAEKQYPDIAARLKGPIEFSIPALLGLDVAAPDLEPVREDDGDDALSTANLYRVANEPMARIKALESRFAELAGPRDAPIDNKPYMLPKDHVGWLNTDQSALYLGLASGSTMRSLVRRHEIIPDGGSGNHHMFRVETLDAYVTGHDACRNQKGKYDGYRSVQAHNHQVPGRVQDAGRPPAGQVQHPDAGRQGGRAQAGDGRGRDGGGHGQRRGSTQGGVLEPEFPVDPYAPPAGYVPNRGALRRIVARDPVPKPKA